MKRQIMLAAGLMLAATSLQADVVAPNDVVANEYGEIAASLTGQAGNPQRGAEIMVSRAAGNCLACHQVSALDEFAWHGEVGPSLDGVATRWDEAGLRGLIVNADVMFPDSIMPSFYRISGYTRPGDAYTGKAPEGELSPLLAAQDIEDVVAYLMTLTDY
ncbi:sulfur oxidation c-type cytochrome SoxX [uncultured Roseicyclus sp.]|uniref:sulfur oxidation c-type cytochrome SoxX n=1 Tax=uncultured Roseicyclus sp. TaxID=543072 RepID=UPI00261010FF|nr:sulfur oxidation c-type cytochrome SoxX [uncultured Roseicyclus sp.]